MNPSPKPLSSIPVPLISAAVGAVVAWWGLSDRMEKTITERVNLTSRVAQLAERIEGLRMEIATLREAAKKP
jgi:hypothetical protein